MSKLPLPERGQPIDVAYLYQIANAVNDLSSQMSTSTYKYVTVDTPATGAQSVKASEARTLAVYKEAYTNSTVTAGAETTITYDFPVNFKYAPVATATIVNTGNTAAGNSTTVTIKTITTSQVSAVVKVGTSGGNATIGVNFIIVGIPN
jgi:hypothetical protein